MVKSILLALILVLTLMAVVDAKASYSWSSSRMKFLRRFGGYGGYGGYYPGGYYQPPVYSWPYGK